MEQISRVREARGKLRKYNSAVYEEVRTENDDKYARQQESLRITKRTLQKKLSKRKHGSTT